MIYVSSAERLARRRGHQAGLLEGMHTGVLEGIGLSLEARFGQAGKKLLAKFKMVSDLPRLRALARVVHSGSSLDDIRLALQTKS